MRSHVAAAPARTACASSPARVNDCVGHRRATARHCIGERSWASSTTTWPYRASAGRSAVTSSTVELVGELLVHAVQLVGGGVTHERGRGVRGLALPAVQPVAARTPRPAGTRVGARTAGSRAAAPPGSARPRGRATVGARRSRAAASGAGPSRTSASSRRATSASLHPSPRHSRRAARPARRRVRMSRPALARRRGDASRRRTSTSGVSTGQMVWRACASAPRSTTSRSGGA